MVSVFLSSKSILMEVTGTLALQLVHPGGAYVTVTVVTPGPTPVTVAELLTPATVATLLSPLLHVYVPPVGVPVAVTLSVFVQSPQMQTSRGVGASVTEHTPGQG